MPVHRRKQLYWLLSLLLFAYYIVDFEYRYRYPILWITFILGALPVVEGLRLLKTEQTETPASSASS